MGQRITDDLLQEFGLKFLKEVNLSENWQVKIEELDLSHQHLLSIENLLQLVNLRVANFSYNRLEKIQGLDECILIEELNLEHNIIEKI